MLDTGLTRKLMACLLFAGMLLVIVGCDDSSQNNEDDPQPESVKPGYGIDDSISHFEQLQSQGKTYDASSVTFDETDEALDYSDEDRAVADTSDLSPEDVIDIPSEGIKKQLASFYSIEAPITFGDVRTIENLNLTAMDLKSIAGIEYFVGLKSLAVGSNKALTSIKGVETLNDLERLNIAHTSVKNIEYVNSSLEELYAYNTLLDLDESDLTTILDIYRGLNLLDVSNTRLQLDRSMVSHWESITDPRYVVLKVDYKQLDYENIGFETFWEIEGFGVRWQHDKIEVQVPFSENTNLEMGPVVSRFVDITDKTYNETLIQTFEILENAIGVQNVDHDLEEIMLIYDYFLENMTHSESGSMSVLDAYNRETVTKTTALEAMSLFYQYRDLPVFSIRYRWQDFDDENANAVNTLNAVYEDRVYALGSYEYFMVGSENAENHMKDVFNGQSNSPFGPSLNELSKRYSGHDFSRSVLKNHAENINIELKFD